MTLEAMDCQSFAGGFAYGVVKAGFKLVGKREYPGGFGVNSMLANRHLLGYDWDVQTSAPEEWDAREVPLVFGNPPCSGFSLLSRSDFRGADSPINSCMWAFTEFAARCRPEIAIFESVQPAFKQGRELMLALRDRMEELTGERYNLHHVLHNSASVGGCAVRKRYFFLISKIPFGIEPPKVDRVPTFAQTIGDLMGMSITWDRQHYKLPPSWWAKKLRNPHGIVDGHYVRTNPLAQRAYDLMEKTHWAQGEAISDVARRYYQQEGALPPSWSATQEKLLGNDFKMGFYQMHRWHWEANARVVTGAASQLVLHPIENRLMTIREVARIQGFPDTWLIGPLRRHSGVDALWGKGIPVQCGEWIAGWAKEAIKGNPGPIAGEPMGDREFKIDVTNDYKSAVLG